MRRKSTYANRGKFLETYIDAANVTYEVRDIALIHKVATPVHVNKLNDKGRIIDGWFKEKSTVDYEGIYRGRSIAFDAKETEIGTRFPLENIEKHQYIYLEKHHKQKGISFIIVFFTAKQETYVLRFEDLKKWVEAAKSGERKSIPYEWFKKNCNLVLPERGIVMDYLSAL